MGILRGVSGDTLLHTYEGPQEIADLAGQRLELYASDPDTGHVALVQADRIFVSDRNRELLRIWFDNGAHLDCTPEHRIMLSDGPTRRQATSRPAT